jgi:hypothetical protein
MRSRAARGLGEEREGERKALGRLGADERDRRSRCEERAPAARAPSDQLGETSYRRDSQSRSWATYSYLGPLAISRFA